LSHGAMIPAASVSNHESFRRRGLLRSG
jgi:hypothetical protein